MITEYLSDTWRFFRNHFLAFAGIILPFAIPLELISAFYHHSIDYGDSFFLSVLPDLLYIMVYPVFGVAIIFYIVSVVKKGERLTASDAWALGIRYYSSYLLLTLILVLAIGFGLALFVIPGILLMVKLAFSEFDLLLQGEDPMASLQSSWRKTTDHFWTLMNGGLVITAIIYIPIWTITYAPVFEGAAGLALNSVIAVAESVVLVAYTVFAYRVYDQVSEDA